MPKDLDEKLRWPKAERVSLALATLSLSLLCWGGGTLSVVHGADAIPSQGASEEDRNPLIGVATRVTDQEIVVDDEGYELAPNVELKTQGGRSLTRSQLVIPTQVRLQFRGQRVVVITQGEWPE
jgi:hypothetical protein